MGRNGLALRCEKPESLMSQLGQSQTFAENAINGGERCGNVGTMIPAGTVERGERKRTVDEVSKAD